MPRHLQLQNGISVTAEDKAFASGGEGDLYRIVYPAAFTHLVLKVYKPEKQTKERKEKIEYLVSNPPPKDSSGAHQAVIWIHQPAYEAGKFAGFTMPLAKGQKLEFLCHTKLPPKLGQEWAKFDFLNSRSLELRLKVCFNIAVAIYQIHSLGSYVIVDLKPENIMIQANGLISIIDTDSLEVMTTKGVKFPAPVATPEYTPPEYYRGTKPEKGGVTEVWDRFGMAVIFYRLLCGIHPFTGTCRSPFEKCTGIPEMIENGLFPYGPKATYFYIVPPPHQNFKKLSKEIQSLFIKCFHYGFNTPDLRPSAEEWCKVLEPKRAMVGNRLLPSSVVSFPDTIPFRPFSTIADLKITVPAGFFYLDIREMMPLELIINLFIGKSRKQELKEKIEIQQEKVRSLLDKKKQWDMEAEVKTDELEAERKDILKNEKQKVQQLQKAFEARITVFDNTARELHTKEQQEIQHIDKAIQNQILKLENENDKVLKPKIKHLERNYMIKKTALEHLTTRTISQDNHQLQELQQGFINKLKNNHDQIEQNESEILKLKENLTKHKPQLINQIKGKYTKLYEELYKKVRYLENEQHVKLTQLYEQTDKLLSSKNKSGSPRFLKFEKEMSAFQKELNKEIQILMQLQNEFMRM